MNLRSIIFGVLLFSFSPVVCTEVQQQEYSFRLLQGQSLQHIVNFYAKVDVEQFSGYPYFYAGSIQEATQYAQWFSGLPRSVIAVAYYNNEPVGLVTGTACVDFDSGGFKQAPDVFNAHGLDCRNFYYVAEVIVLPEHRNKKLAEKLYYMVEAHAQELGYQNICYAKESDENDARKPFDYKGLGQAFSQKGGYQRTDMVVHGLWLTYMPDGSVQMQDHELRFWMKKIA